MNNNFIKTILFPVVLGLFIVPNLVFGANVFFTPESQEVAVEQEFIANIFLNTQGESINAAEVKIFYPENLLEVKEVRDGGSVVKYWVQRPQVNQTGIINFSGIVPGGYQGNNGSLFSVVFKAKTEGQGKIELKEAQALKNDGKGTAVETTVSAFDFSISKRTGEVPQLETTTDTTPPEDFVPEVSRTAGLYEGKWFVVFAAQDKESGIDHYEIMESGQAGSVQDSNIQNQWKVALSPYILSDQSLKSEIKIKAVDKAGNERIVIVPTQKKLSAYENYYIWFIILVLVILFVGYKLWKKSRNQN